MSNLRESRELEKQIIEEMTDAQIQEYRASFSIFDRDNDGVITPEELHSVMKSLGEDPTEDEVQEMIYEVDQEGKGSINFHEFVIMMNRKSEMQQDENEDIKAAFFVFDKNHDGFVSVDEMKEVLSRFDLSTPSEEIVEMIKTVDTDGDGMLSFEEFTNLMKSTEALKLTNVKHYTLENDARNSVEKS